jgi:hypothetical protein
MNTEMRLNLFETVNDSAIVDLVVEFVYDWNALVRKELSERNNVIRLSAVESGSFKLYMKFWEDLNAEVKPLFLSDREISEASLISGDTSISSLDTNAPVECNIGNSNVYSQKNGGDTPSFFDGAGRKRLSPTYRVNWFEDNVMLDYVGGIQVESQFSYIGFGRIEKLVVFSALETCPRHNIFKNMRQVYQDLFQFIATEIFPLTQKVSLDENPDESMKLEKNASWLYWEIMMTHLFNSEFPKASKNLWWKLPEATSNLLTKFKITEKYKEVLNSKYIILHKHIFDFLSRKYGMIGYSNGVGLCQISKETWHNCFQNPPENITIPIPGFGEVSALMTIYRYAQYRCKPFGFRAWQTPQKDAVHSVLKCPHGKDPFDQKKRHEKYRTVTENDIVPMD